jgi:hypothetical protein
VGEGVSVSVFVGGEREAENVGCFACRVLGLPRFYRQV